MTTKLEGLLPSAKDFARKLALAEAAKAAKDARKREADEADRVDLIKQLQGPSGVSDDEAIRRAVRMVERAVDDGQTEVMVYRFPHILCADGGRAINQREAGWENTLTGVPKEVYRVWEKYFRPEGYKLHVQIIDFPGGFPGDVGMTLSWT